MQISLLGATGRIGKRVIAEALERGHTITAVARHPRTEPADERITPRRADVRQVEQLRDAIALHDAVVSAVGPREGETPLLVVDAARALAAAAMKTGVKRLVIVGGAGSLAVEPGIELMATPDFPAEWREIAQAHREALEIWRRVKELSWTYVSPAASLEPGRRTGKYRVGHNDLVVDDQGQSRISMEDFAVAIVDEIENNAHLRERINVAY